VTACQQACRQRRPQILLPDNFRLVDHGYAVEHVLRLGEFRICQVFGHEVS